MTLKDYTALLQEIKQLDGRIESLRTRIDEMTPRTAPVSDTVTRGKRGKKPLGVVRIEGMQDYSRINKKMQILQNRIAALADLRKRSEQEAAEIEKVILGIEDVDTRRLIGFYCLDGCRTWDEVAERMGAGWTAEACRKRYSRFVRRGNDGNSTGK